VATTSVAVPQDMSLRGTHGSPVNEKKHCAPQTNNKKITNCNIRRPD
jgi:hypothetical protein